MVKRHQILVITRDTNGIVMRIMSLFNRRGYNVQKLTAGSTHVDGYARLTLTVEGDEKILDQIQKQVYKITDVTKVKVFPDEGVIRRESMLLKVKAGDHNRANIVQIAQIYRGQVLDVSPASMVIEVTGDVSKLQGFVDIMKDYGILEIARTGVLAMSRGSKI